MTVSRSARSLIGNWNAEGKKNISFHQVMMRIAQLRQAVRDNYSKMTYAQQCEVVNGVAETISKISKEE